MASVRSVTQEELAEVLREPPENWMAKMDEVAARAGWQPGFPAHIAVSPEIWAMWQEALKDLSSPSSTAPPISES